MDELRKAMNIHDKPQYKLEPLFDRKTYESHLESIRLDLTDFLCLQSLCSHKIMDIREKACEKGINALTLTSIQYFEDLERRFTNIVKRIHKRNGCYIGDEIGDTDR